MAQEENNGVVYVKDGVTWYWCIHHFLESEFDGLYCTHKPEDHKGRRLQKSRDNGGGNGANRSNGNGTKLVLSDKLKEALLTDHGFNDFQLA